MGCARFGLAAAAAVAMATQLGCASELHGQAVVVASKQVFPGTITVHGGHVYWANVLDRTVMRASVEGGAVEQVAQLDDPAVALAVTKDALYAATGPSLLKLGLGETTLAPETLAAGKGIFFVAADEAGAYYADNAPGEALLAKVSSIGGDPVPIASGLKSIGALAVDGGNAYFTDYASGDVLAAAVGDGHGAARPLAQGQAKPNAIAVAGGYVYFLDEGTADAKYADGSVVRVSTSGGAPQVLASGQGRPSYIAVDDRDVYWVNYTSGTLMHVAAEGGSAEAIARDQGYVGGLALDAKHLYWTTFGTTDAGFHDGRVMRQTK